MYTPRGDRRANTRFEIIGVMAGQLEFVQSAKLLNLSRSGALIESPRPMALDATELVRLTVDDEPLTAEARVRHARCIPEKSGTARYEIGVEFVAPAGALRERLMSNS
jgi:hypothetical protein